MTVNQTPAAKASRYNPNAIRRCVRRDTAQPAGQVVFVTKSFTRADGPTHHPTVDAETGACFCTCEHFTYRLAKKNPTVFSPDADLCKHLLRAIENLARAGQLPQQRGQFAPACIHCGAQNADDYFEVADDSGHAMPGRVICDACAHAASDDLSDAKPECPPHVDPVTGELRKGFRPDGSVDYTTMFED